MARNKEFDQTAVLDKAVTIFWQQGYEHTSIQDLVDYMGIHRRSIYDTFGDKHALFLQVLGRYEQYATRLFTAAIDDRMTIKKKFERIFQVAAFQPASVPRGCLLVNTAAELSLLDEEVAKKIASFFARTKNYFQQLLIQAQKQGELSEAEDVAQLADYLHNALTGVRVLVKTAPPEAELTGIINLTLAVFDR